MDVERQVDYWRKGSDEDMSIAEELLDHGRLRYAIFFAHLALEKMLKAHVTEASRTLPPKIHNLARLEQLAGLPMTDAHRTVLLRMNAYQIEARYPRLESEIVLDAEHAGELMARTREVLGWLKARFST